MTETLAQQQTGPKKGIPELTRTHKFLIGVVAVGAVVIAGIGFAGSYAAVRQLALDKGFGWFANVFPIGVDAGIVVLLALDLLLTWLRIPFPMLRQAAWLLTAATIAFNGAAAWPDGLGVGMHGVIPILFVVSVEAARHAIGRIADITADKHMEGVRFTRWLLAPFPTFRLWRRMKLWELRSYEEVIRREQDRLVYRARLRARYGVAWRRKAPVEAVMPLRLAKYGVPLTDTADAGLTAAGIEAPLRAAEMQLADVANVPELEQGQVSESAVPELPAVNGAPETAATDGAEFEQLPLELQAGLAPDPDEARFAAYRQYLTAQGTFPTGQEFADHLAEQASVPSLAAARPDEGVGVQVQVPEDVVDMWADGHLDVGPADDGADGGQAEPVVAPEPVAEPVVEVPVRPEPVPAAPARSAAPKRVQAKLDGEGGQLARASRGRNTRARVAEIYRGLPEQDRGLRGRPLARAITDASGGDLKFETVKKSHISEELLAEYLQSAPQQAPEPREEPEDAR